MPLQSREINRHVRTQLDFDDVVIAGVWRGWTADVYRSNVVGCSNDRLAKQEARCELLVIARRPHSN